VGRASCLAWPTSAIRLRPFWAPSILWGSNISVMNKIPLKRVKETGPEFYKPYAIHVLMYEYIHGPGYPCRSRKDGV
jgi:hypothetical protein